MTLWEMLDVFNDFMGNIKAKSKESPINKIRSEIFDSCLKASQGERGFYSLCVPTSGLDPVARDEICNLLKEFVEDKNRSVIFFTHITLDLEKIADHITFILNGNIIFSGKKDDLLNKYKGMIENKNGTVMDINLEEIIIFMNREMKFHE